MGNDQSISSNRMAIAAMSSVMKLTKTQLLLLRDTCLSYASVNPKYRAENSSSPPRIGRRDFRAAMNEVGIRNETDIDVLDKLFVMADLTGEDRVEILPFLVGLSPLATIRDVDSKLKLAFVVYDVRNIGLITYDDLLAVLSAINVTASYFGDAVLSPHQLEDIASDIFHSAGVKQLGYAAHVHEVISHPLVDQFAHGEGSSRYSEGD